jgi:hypothetical protein
MTHQCYWSVVHPCVRRAAVEAKAIADEVPTMSYARSMKTPGGSSVGAHFEDPFASLGLTNTDSYGDDDGHHHHGGGGAHRDPAVSAASGHSANTPTPSATPGTTPAMSQRPSAAELANLVAGSISVACPACVSPRFDLISLSPLSLSPRVSAGDGEGASINPAGQWPQETKTPFFDAERPTTSGAAATAVTAAAAEGGGSGSPAMSVGSMIGRGDAAANAAAAAAAAAAAGGGGGSVGDDVSLQGTIDLWYDRSSSYPPPRLSLTWIPPSAPRPRDTGPKPRYCGPKRPSRGPKKKPCF